MLRSCCSMLFDRPNGALKRSPSHHGANATLYYDCMKCIRTTTCTRQLHAYAVGTKEQYLHIEGRGNMLKVVARQKVREGMAERFQELGRELVAASKNDEGNIDYSLNRSVTDPSVFCFLEVWESKEALEAHMAAEHFQRIVPQIGELTEQDTNQTDLYIVV